MADTLRPARLLLDQIFGEPALAQNAGLDKLRADLQNSSIFPLVKQDAEGLISQYGLSRADAQKVIRPLRCMATYILRQYIEHSRRGSDESANQPSSGLLSIVDGPNLDRLFSPKFEQMCPVGSPEAIDSVQAYLVNLYQLIEQEIEAAGDARIKPLHERRADLMSLMVDEQSTHQRVSSVEVSNSILQTFIDSHIPKDVQQDALIATRYPNGLPYYQPWSTIEEVVRSHELLAGDFARAVDLLPPAFLRAQDWVAGSGAAWAHDTGLGPYQRELLTEPFIPFQEGIYQQFYLDNFGAEGTEVANLNQVKFFCERTKLDTPTLTRLLSVGAFESVRSPNVRYGTDDDDTSESGRYGSVYINGNSHPGIGFYDGGSHYARIELGPRTAEGVTGYDRMNRKLRLDKWLEMPSGEVDDVVAALINAERRGAGNDTWAISENVVHGLGLFQRLRKHYNCSAADFAVFVDQLAIYGRGETLSQFDRIFNDQGSHRAPFVLDGEAFDWVPVPGTVDLTVSQLCSGLGINLQTYHYLALAVAGTCPPDTKLPRSRAVISSFYRLVALARMFGISPVEAISLLSLLGGKPWLDGLAGQPCIDPDGDGPDALHLIEAMHACVQWCHQSDLPVLWMLQHVSPLLALSEASDRDLQFFDQVRGLLPAALFSENALLIAGVQPARADSWVHLLSIEAGGLKPLMDEDGLLLAPSGTAEEYRAFILKKLQWAISAAVGDLPPAELESILATLLTVYDQAGEAQTSVVQETLAVYAAIAAEQVLPTLNCAGATVYELLRQIKDLPAAETAQTRRSRTESPPALLDLLARLRRFSEIFTRLGLSARLLQDFLNYGSQAWIGHAPDDFSLATLYYLTVMTQAIASSDQPEQDLLDYLQEVNQLREDLSGDALTLAQKAAEIRLALFLGWSVQDVHECVLHIAPTTKVLKTLPQLDVLMRLRKLSVQSGMDAKTILLIGKLPEDAVSEQYATAADFALLSETELRVPVIPGAGDLEQLVNMVCVLDSPTVIANKPDEKAHYTVTVTDADNKPVRGLRLNWQTSLGNILSTDTGTDVNGKLIATYTPGALPGRETPLFWPALFQPRPADPVEIIADLTTMSPEKISQVPVTNVKIGQPVEFGIQLLDNYDNPGKKRTVEWRWRPTEDETIWTAIIEPDHGVTNEQGFSRVLVSSETGGTFEIAVKSEDSGNTAYFDFITFADNEPAP